MRRTTNTTTMRERSHRASSQPDYSYSGRRWLGPRDREEQRTQRASFVATWYVSYESTHNAAAAGHRAGLGCLVEKKYHRLGTSRRGQTGVSQRGLDARVQGRAKDTQRGVRHDSSRRWLGFSECKTLTAE